MSPTPRATYRLQFREGMDFRKAAELVPYLAELGISHLYASPITTARNGSTHGYDAADLTELDPALGGEEGFRVLSDRLREHGIGLLLDFVPNHMGIAPENRWWWSVLAEGPQSPFASHFDIDWQRYPGPRGGRVLLPVLGEPYGSILEKGELRLRLAEDSGTVELGYHEQRFPIATDTLEKIDPTLPALLERGAGEELQRALDDASAPDRLHPILELQHYRLAHWRMAGYALNYRRFFDINELIGLRIEDPAVFEACHPLVLRLIREGRLDGLRLDHVDGLGDPGEYLERLQATCREAAGTGRPFWLLVEKILEPGEELPASWPVAGTTGYDYLNEALGLFLDSGGLARLAAACRVFTGVEAGFEEIVADAKRLVLERLFAGELEALTRRAAELLADDKVGRDLPSPLLRHALMDLLVAFPVYRTYVDARGASNADEALLASVAETARAATSLEDATAIDVLARLLEGHQPGHRRLAVRFQQLSGPLMAKALEDTAFYRWHRLAAASEVGGAPAHPAIDTAAFHAANARRQAHAPLGLLASATHDTKRGEDVRARLAVLSEAVELWTGAAMRWAERNAALRATLPDGAAPERNAEYLFYQSLVGIWPLERADPASLADRLAAYMRKALREAKQRTSWTAPCATYETAVEDFVRAALDPGRSAPFLDEVGAFVRRIAPAAALNSLSQTLLKLTVPGVPDIYQGTELWDLSLVDPDNRRPVDFAARAAVLRAQEPLGKSLASWHDGRLKLGLIARILAWRRQWPDVLGDGAYLPLAVEGPHAASLLAFARKGATGPAVITVVPRLAFGLLGDAQQPLPPASVWQGTRLVLPAELNRHEGWHDILTGRRHSSGDLAVSGLLGSFPVAFLASTS
ncbi:malto-oligosyltrehalose synthase [Geminicoccaceae bacterium 1502E]|nr:malto-oligosyltrehalose synthase [Geminicoccaceae bacterium 1502E]